MVEASLLQQMIELFKIVFFILLNVSSTYQINGSRICIIYLRLEIFVKLLPGKLTDECCRVIAAGRHRRERYRF